MSDQIATSTNHIRPSCRQVEEYEAPATADADALLRFLGPAPA